MSKYPSSQKLWRIVQEPNGYYFEIKLKGMVIDRLPINEPTIKVLKEEEVI